ncbi:MAG TPA: hypothetical protein VNL15_03770, partial [Dehalococcoidia bacterium]|nr:hypothetical protein [Dehalococcoidia bacterium]
GLSALILVKPLAVFFGVLALGLTVLLTNEAIRRSEDMTGQQALGANLAGFAAFSIAMGIVAGISSVSGLGGTAPGLYFFTVLDL